MAEKVIFDGETKTITIKPGVTEIDVLLDLFVPWKNWVHEDNAQWLNAFKPGGREPTNSDGTQFTPSYIFIMNNWAIVGNTGENILIQTNLYPDPNGSTTVESMFVTTNNTNIFNRQSDSPIVVNELEQSLEYGGIIYVDSSVIETGNIYPYGTAAKPVNNMTDAMVIGRYYGFKKYHVIGTITITKDASDFEVTGGAGETLIINEGYTITNAIFTNCTIQGDLGVLSNGIQYRNCIGADGITNVGSEWYNSGFLGEIILKDNATILLINCFSRPKVSQTGFILNANSSTTNAFIIIKGFMGKMFVENINHINKIATLSFNSGSCILKNTNTAGKISIRNIPYSAYINETNSENLIIETGGLLVSQLTIDEASQKIDYAGIVVIDTEHGVSGTEYPVGTHETPANNFTDAMVILRNRNLEKLYIHNSISIDQDITGLVIEGKSGKEALIFMGVNVDECYFINLYLGGATDNSSSFRAIRCAFIDGFTGANGSFDTCGILGDITITGTNPTLFLNCFSLGYNKIMPRIIIGEVDDEISYFVNLRKYFGKIKIENMSHSSQLLTAGFSGGGIEFTNSNIAGEVVVSGLTTQAIKDNSNGLNIKIENAPSSNIDTNTILTILEQFNFSNGEVLAILSEASKQVVRDAQALTTGEIAEIGSIDNYLDRIDKNTQE